MVQAATGFRVHSGWAAAVTVAALRGSLEVVDRRVIQLADAKIKGSKQPFHAAEGLPMKQAEALIGRCRESTRALARLALDEIARTHEIGASAILRSSARPLPDLAAILASHALIHTAEGEFFREAIRDATHDRGLLFRAVQERNLFQVCEEELRLSRAELDRKLAEWGKQMGSPWRQDEKFAALVAWLAVGRAF
jgi:hypothetical protein